MRFAGDRWIDSADGQRARQRKRDAVRVFVRSLGEPRSKGAIKAGEKDAFRRALAEGLGHRQRFRAPVMLELDLYPTASNPPEIHTVAKNYIDLLYTGDASEPKLLGDDRQVQYLAVRYIAGAASEPSIFLRANRMSCFREEVRLVQRIRSDRHDSWHDEDDEEKEDEENPIDELRRWERLRPRMASASERELFDLNRRFLLAQVQQRRLASTERFVHSILVDLLGLDQATVLPAFSVRGARFPALHLGEAFRSMLFSSTVSLRLGDLPAEHGDGDAFQEAMRVALRTLRASQPSLFPLFVQLAVVILVVPPDPRMPGHPPDLDNLARHVIPLVHSVLQPPGTTPLLVDPQTVAEPRLREFFEREVRLARRLPKHHVTRFEVVRLPRMPGDPRSGSVRLALCDGTEGRSFAEFVAKTIDNWIEADD